MADNTYEAFKEEQLANYKWLRGVLAKYVEVVANPEQMHSVPPAALSSLPEVAEVLRKLISANI